MGLAVLSVCPFCGAPGLVKRNREHTQIVCDQYPHKCGGSTRWLFNLEDAMAAWNRREPSSAPIAVRADRTSAAEWRVKGEPDPHAGHYDGERAALTLGTLTDDELANGVYMNADQPMDIDRMLRKDPGYHPPIAWLTAAKERIRWLSRALVKEYAARISDEADARDAARYRWLRAQYWNSSNLFVIAGSKSQVRLGTDCPNHDRLDSAIDAAIRARQPEHGDKL
jgi:hypothetical protein